jgi:oligo-1,6-glucosidase
MNREVGIADRHLLTVGEMGLSTIEQARRVTDPARHELDMLFSFEHVWLDQVAGRTKFDLKPLHLPDLKGVLARWQTGLADVGWNSLYWDNHDQPRVVSRFGDDSDEHRVVSAKTLATVLHLHRGTPYVYQGEELGMTNAGFTTIDEYVDVESLNWAHEALARGVPEQDVLHSLAVKSRDNARTPMQWDATEHAGFTTGTPWLPAHANRDVVNAGGDRRPRLGLPPLPAADRAAAHRTGRRGRTLRAAAAGPPDPLGLHPHARRRRAAGARQPLRLPGAAVARRRARPRAG